MASAPHAPAIQDPLALLGAAFQAGIRAAYPELEGTIDPLIAGSKNTAFGDFQSNAAMGLSKRLGKQPREVAQAIVKHTDLGTIAEPLTDAAIAGPGFINIKLRGEALASMVASMDSAALGIEPAANPQTVVVDLFGVNLAKQMHVGHLRSPIIGDAIARTLERQGHKVLRQNHVGDWGLPIAMVTDRLIKLSKAGKIDLNTITLEDLDKNYKAAQAECQRDASGLATAQKYGLGPKVLAELEEQVAGATEAFLSARQTLIKLQAKEPATFAVWQKIADVTMGVCLAVAKRMNVNVTAEHSAGESSYADELPALVADLESRGIAEPDQGALIVRLDDPNGPHVPFYGVIKEPCLIRKTDGGYLYATTDIAAVRRRVQKLGASRAIYAIDARQALHLKQVYASSVKAGYATGKNGIAKLEHAPFGSVLGEDGKPFKTRSGESVNLQALLDEAAARAKASIASRQNADNPMSEAELAATAEAIGIAALKYADLSNDRAKDYVFSFERMLAFEGNTGPYLLYALVRIKSIFRKAAEKGIGEAAWRSAPIVIQQSQEKTLALMLLRYPQAVEGVAQSLEPHRLCGYIYDLAGAFSSFFESCPVLTAPDDATRNARLRLCDLTARVLADGLKTLGIPTVERM